MSALLCKPHQLNDYPTTSAQCCPRAAPTSRCARQIASFHSAGWSRRSVIGSSPSAPKLLSSTQLASCSAHVYPTFQVAYGVAYQQAYQQESQQTYQPTYQQTYQQENCLWRNDYNQHYIHGKLLGAGSFGNVHLGIHRRSGVEVAVKIMPKKRGNLTREKTIGRITKEVSILEALQDCGNIVRLYGCFDDAEEVQLVMEYCSGGDLQRALDVDGLFPEYDLAVVANEVLKVIKACHDKSVLHGDVKPANFVFTRPRSHLQYLPYRGDWLRAIDFGCSQFLPCGERLGRRVGTPAYMAPEVFGRDAGIEADMWSLGVMLYQLYTGRFPFWEGRIQPGVTGVEKVMDAVMNSPLLIEGTMFPTLSTNGKDFIIRCLQRDFDSRLTVDEALQHPWFCSMLCTSNSVPAGSCFAPQSGCSKQAHYCQS